MRSDRIQRFDTPISSSSREVPRVVRRVGVPCAALALLTMLSACSSNDPRRDARLAWDGKSIFERPAVCAQLYAGNDSRIWKEMKDPASTDESRQKLLAALASQVDAESSPGGTPKANCWTTSYENHQDLPAVGLGTSGSADVLPGYDLLVAEFDDQGERTDVSLANVPFERSEVSLVESQLEAMLDQEVGKGGGINLVVLTHGWHGNASASNDYSTMFKAILQQITEYEGTSRRSTCRRLRSEMSAMAVPAERARLQSRLEEQACQPKDSDDSGRFAPRRTVGVEIAWRGDSETIPLLTWANFWDRKNAIETLSKGGVHDLVARLHKFYIAHSCHGRPGGTTASGAPCDQVHLLSIGHSFGALIDFQTLNDDIATGLLGNGHGRAYGFGDMTVLLNPAFEGERMSTLFDAAMHRGPYPASVWPADADRKPGSAATPAGAQIPTLAILQSQGDWATHYLFPTARLFTSLFENTPGKHEYARGLTAAGWVDDFHTHLLQYTERPGQDTCLDALPHPAWFCPFDWIHEGTDRQSVNLRWDRPSGAPDYFPLWNVGVSSAIMKNHDDIWNPSVIRFIAKLFRTAYDQEDRINDMYKRAPQTKPLPPKS